MRRAGFDAYYIDSVEDKHACDTCKKISTRSHEEPFRFDDARPGENYPPLHPRCRCEVNPAVDDWADFINGGSGRPQDRARVAERFGAGRVDLYARVMSELATYVPRIGVDEGTIVKAIGDFVYTVEVKAHDYRIVGRRRIE